MTIDVVTRQLMDDQGVTTLRDALRNVPGISLAAGEAASQGDNLTIRGFTARNDIYLDGMRDFGSYYRDPFYLEDIQVLKGPASILFGKGSTGGVVEQDSKLPKLTPFYTGTAVFGTDLTQAPHRRRQPAAAGSRRRRGVADQCDGATATISPTATSPKTSRFGIAPSLALGLGTPTRLIFTYLHQTRIRHSRLRAAVALFRRRPGSPPTIARPAPLSLTQSNYYGFENGNYLRTNADVATVKVEHDFNKDLTLSNQFRYAHYVRAVRHHRAAALHAGQRRTPGGTGVAVLIPPGTPLSSLVVSRNQLDGHSLETYLVNDLDMTAHFTTGSLEHTLRAGHRGRPGDLRPAPLLRRSAPTARRRCSTPNPSDTYNANTYLSTRTNTIGATPSRSTRSTRSS